MSEPAGEPGHGEHLRVLRDASGLTQAEAAERLGKDKNTIYRWESGMRKISAVDFDKAVALYTAVTAERQKKVPRGTANREFPTAEDDSWSPNPSLVNKIPKRAYDVAIAYCRRLQSVEWPRDEIEQIERLMIDPRYAQANKRKGQELSVDDHIMLIDATWEAVKATAAALGRPV